MDYSGDKNGLTELTQNVFLRETCPGEFDDFNDILGSKWYNLETVEQAELNANERCADWDKNPVVEENTGNKNILLSWIKKNSRIPANPRMSSYFAV